MTDPAFCSNCGRPFPTADLTRFGDSPVCAACKNILVPNTLVYGGFWRRFAAILLDGLILGACGFAVNQILNLMVPVDVTQLQPGMFDRVTPMGRGGALVNLAIAIGYQIYFLTRSGATPGKMALGLKIIRVDGEPLTPALAIGRYFAQILSAMILMIGFIMAAFDPQKRALHDYICQTRVIRIA